MRIVVFSARFATYKNRVTQRVALSRAEYAKANVLGKRCCGSKRLTACV